MKALRLPLLAATCLALASTAPAASPVLLLRDNFDAATANVNDLNVDLARQTGTLAPLAYSLAFGPAHYGHQLQNDNAQNQLLLADFPNSTVSLNFNFNAARSAGGLKISFDLDSMPTVYGGTPDNWGCINLGLAAGNQLGDVNGGAPHFGILFRAAGTIQAFDGSTVVSPAAEPVYSTRPPGTTNHIDLIVTDTDGNPFDGAGNTIIEVFANGGALPVYTFTKTGGYPNNYLNLQGSFRAHFDNFEVTQLPADRAPVIVNPSFEADTFTVFPGYVSGNGPITGWNALGGHGVNPGTFGGPFSDNGAIPQGTKVAFMQDDGPLSQTISGFSISATYQIRYFENARSGGTPSCEVTIGGNTIVAAHAVSPVGAANPYREVTSDPFTATGTSMDLAFIKSNPLGGDTTLLIDNISLIAPNTPPTITVQPQDQIVGLGDTATFTVGAAGSAPLTFQWYFGADALPGANAATLNVLSDFPDVAGNYYVIVANGSGSITSRVATLTVRARVPGLFNTGVDDFAAALGDGAVDPHYTLIVNADGPSTDAIVENSTAFPIVAGPWVANDANGKWIGPRFDTSAAAGLATGGGVYVYRQTFDLTGLDLSSVVITGGWAVDNEGQNIRVNGVDTGVINGNGFGSLTSFTLNGLNATFVDGVNTLDFVVRNVDVTAGYTGLRVANLRGLAELPGTPPTITTQPQSQLAATGESVSFVVIASGSSPLSYEWRKNGVAIPGATGAVFSIASVLNGDAGAYSVVVSNAFGTVQSAGATLTVRDAVPGFFNTGVDESKVALADGAADPHYALIVNPDSASPTAVVEDSTVFPIVTGPWVANTAASKWIGPRLETSGAAGAAGDGGNYVYRTTIDLTGFDPASVVLSGVWATDNAGSDILINGQSTGQANTVQFVSFTPFTISSGFVAGINTIDFTLNNSDVGYTGLRVDQVRAYGIALPLNTPPFILAQPQGQSALLGETVVFTVVANGSVPLSYQWFFGSDPLPGETGPTLTVSFDFPDQAGDYHVVVSNDAGSVTSDPATSSGPNQPPSFTAGPNQTVPQDVGPQSIAGWASNINPGAPNETAQALTFLVSNNNPGLFTAQPAISSAGTLTYQSALSATGMATVTVILMDNGGTANGGIDRSGPATFLITITPVLNHPPTAVLRLAGLCDETPSLDHLEVISTNGSNGCVVLDGSMSIDPDHDPLTYHWFLDGDPIPFASGAVATNCLELGEHTILLIVDDGHASGSATATADVITGCEAVENLIRDVNDANLARKNKRPLIASLKGACASFDRSGFEAGANQLRAFQNKVRAQIARQNPVEADQFTRAAGKIIDAMECGQ